MSCRVSVAAILDNSTPFSPLSDRCPVSTLKDTVSTASRLQKALAIVESVDELPSLIHPDDEGKNSNNVPPAATNGDGHQLTFGNSMADPEDSILRPSTSADRLSVEDMQRSLSREGSPNNTTAACGPEGEEGEGSMLTFMNPAVSVAERSISFAPTTTQVRCPRKRVAKFYYFFFSTVFPKSLRYLNTYLKGNLYIVKKYGTSTVPVLRILIIYPRSEFFTSRILGQKASRTRIRIKEFKYLNPTHFF
jgi:hypothetical protein